METFITVLLLLLLMDTGLSSTDPYHIKGASKQVVGLRTLIQNRRHLAGVEPISYCSSLAAECFYNNQLQRRYGQGSYLQEERVVVASDRMWPIDVFHHVLCDEPYYSMSISPKITKWAAHYDGHFWTIVLK